MTDIEIRQVREDLIEFINGIQLPLEVKRLILNEVCEAVTKAADDFINSQRISIAKQVSEMQEEKTEETPVEETNNVE